MYTLSHFHQSYESIYDIDGMKQSLGFAVDTFTGKYCLIAFNAQYEFAISARNS